MFKPTVGELLEGVTQSLRESVLNSLPSGTPQRQLRAALHVLGRLQRCWDLLPGYLDADVQDMRTTLQTLLTDPALAADDVLVALKAKLDAVRAPDQATVRGVNSPELAAQCSVHEQLQAIVAETNAAVSGAVRHASESRDEARASLGRLFARMSERQLSGWGTPASES